MAIPYYIDDQVMLSCCTKPDDAPLMIHLASADEIVGVLTGLIAEVERLRVVKRGNEAEIEGLRAAVERVRELAGDPSHGPLYAHKILDALEADR